jgi:membrane protein
MNLAPLQEHWQTLKTSTRFLLNRMQDHRLPQVAGSLSFTTVLSIVPLVVVMLSVLTIFPVFQTFQKIIQQFMLDNLMPEKMSNVVMKQITQFAEQSSRLSLLSMILMIFSTLMTMGTIDRVFNDIWKVKRRGLMRKNVLVYWAVLTLGPICFGLVLLAGQFIIAALNHSPVFQGILSLLIPFALSVLAFSSLYVFVPNRRVLWKDAVIGGLVTAVLFVALTNGFASVFKGFQVYAVIYSAFSIIPAFFLWLYVFWMIVLFGASLTASLPILKFERWRKEPRAGDGLPEALMILYVLYQAQHSPSHMLSWSALQSHMRLNSEELADIVIKLQENGWVAKIRRHDEGTGWALICDTTQVTLADLYDVFVFNSQYFADKAQKNHLPWASIFTNMHNSTYHHVSLSELFGAR